jgi:rare lipoprotein A
VNASALRASWLLIAAALAGGCSGAARWEQAAAYEPTPAPDARPATTRNDGQPPKSRRGNPVFYEVFGQRYYVLNTSSGYAERGVASWYGNKFHGKPTSSGEPYNMHAMTAAHKTLPLPTRVRVRNLANGRSVVVVVNDRGPFVDNRIIDLSYAAAHQLDMVTDGTAMVEVTAYPYSEPSAPLTPVLASAEPEPQADGLRLPSPIATANAAPPDPAEGRTVTLFMQVGAFSQADNAARFKAKLEKSGLSDVVIHADTGGENEIYRVRIGPIADVADYDRLVERVAALDIRNPHLVSDADADFVASRPGG